MILNLDIELNPTQRDLLNLINQNKFTVANISRQQGKSVLAKLLAIQWLFQKNKVISYITPTLKLAKKIFKDISSVLPPSLLVTNNASDLILESVTGSSLWFYSSEQGDKIRGITNNYLIVDEVAFLKNDRDLWFGILQPTIKVKGEKILFISTPNGTNSLFYDLAMKAQSGINDWGYIKRTIYEDSYCSDIEELKRTTPELLFKQEYLCEFIEDANSFFKNHHQCYIEGLDFNFNSKLFFGIDFSSVGSDETIFTLINSEGQILQELITGDLNLKYKKLSELISKYNCYGYAETNSIGSVMVNEIKKLLKGKSNLIKDWNTSNQSKTDIITELAINLENGDLSYSDKSLDYQLSSFGYSITKTKKLSFAGVNSKDDRVMSLAIANKARKDLIGYSKSNFAFINGRN